jgi:AhpD family alkylhydroperoxidase
MRDEMDERTYELVGIAASVAGHCQPCLKYHIKAAKKLGVETKAIRAAVALAKAISGAGDESMSELAAKLLIEKARPGTGSR